jgi:hypothetical protein
VEIMTVLAILAATVLAAQGAGKGDAPAVLETHFLGTNQQGEMVETTNIRHRPGSSCYTWVILVEPESRELAVREVFELPDSAQNWNSGPSEVTVVNRERSGAVTEFSDSLDDGLITHGWCVAEGDPIGRHRIRVFVGDRLLHEFRFNIVTDAY